MKLLTLRLSEIEQIDIPLGRAPNNVIYTKKAEKKKDEKEMLYEAFQMVRPISRYFLDDETLRALVEFEDTLGPDAQVIVWQQDDYYDGNDTSCLVAVEMPREWNHPLPLDYKYPTPNQYYRFAYLAIRYRWKWHENDPTADVFTSEEVAA
ncbi:MAG: hypothetical protein HY661_03765 [Betaproteobacteria bacterium]|nr:hypothetical protein [Betaproteobacteria bacterium]